LLRSGAAAGTLRQDVGADDVLVGLSTTHHAANSKNVGR